MLIVDPVKRITVAEIRQLPWFQQGLPAYLQPMPPTPAAEPSGFDFGMSNMTQAESDKMGEGELDDATIAPNIGIVEEDIVAELAEKMIGFSVEELKQRLLEAEENQVKVAYHLVRDHKRMLETTHLDQNAGMEAFLAQSPPAWNAGLDDVMARSTSLRRKKGPSGRATASGMPQYEGVGEESTMSEQDGGNVTDEVATEAFASEDEGALSATDEDETGLYTEDDDVDEPGHNAAVNIAILENSIPGLRTDETPSSETVPLTTSSSRRSRNRWHFGIRSRSPPMEIMLELYRTLQVLGMEWRAKAPNAKGKDGEEGGDDEHQQQAGEKHQHDDSGRGEDLFFVETRWKVNDVVVRMNLQLYRVDEANYLVDFRNVGYVRMQKKQDGQLDSDVVSPVDAESIDTSPDQARIHEALDQAYKSSEEAAAAATNAEVPSSAKRNQPMSTDTAAEGRKEVSSPFLFLECATRLIVELAGGG